MNRKLKQLKIDNVAMETLLHLRDGEADGSLRSNTAAAEGGSYALGDGAVALGTGTKASGINSHAEGHQTVASGTWSHSECLLTTASGNNSHAEGYQTVASGGGAHAEGDQTVASGGGAHAEGDQTVASGRHSHAGGHKTIAQRKFQTVIGAFNAPDTGGADEESIGNFYFIIGNGSQEAIRANAMEVKWNGDTRISGTLTQSSDRRLKDHREYLGTKSLEFIRKLKPAYFFKDQEPHVGLYAQDIESEDPYRTILGEMNGFLTVNYTELIPHLITYCQHLEQRIEELERR